MQDRDRQHFEQVYRQRFAQHRHTIPNLRVQKAAEILRRGGKLLDIGCGDGSLCLRVMESFDQVHGVDIVPRAVEAAKSNGVQAQLCNLNVEPLPYAAQSFDVLAMLAVLQCIYDPLFALQECHRVLKPGGQFLMCLPNMRTVGKLFKLIVLGTFPRTSADEVGYDGGTLHYFCYRNMVHLLNDTGFVVERSYGLYHRPAVLGLLPDHTLLGMLKREFFSGEILIMARRSE